MFPVRLETENLVMLKPSTEPTVVREVYDVCSSDAGIEEVTRHVPWTPHETINETREFLEYNETLFDDGEKATYLLRHRKTDEFVGIGSLSPDWSHQSGILGCWIRKKFWGNGYSGERASALFELGFTNLGLELIGVSHLSRNKKSRRAIERYIDKHNGQHTGMIRRTAGEEWNGLSNNHILTFHEYSVSKDEYGSADVDSVIEEISWKTSA